MPKLTAASLANDADEPTPDPQPHQEIVYEGTCQGEPCFIIEHVEDENGNSVEGIYGICTGTEAKIAVELAKQQRLCDHQQTRYAPQHKENANHNRKIDEKKILRCPVKLDVRMSQDNPVKPTKQTRRKNRV